MQTLLGSTIFLINKSDKRVFITWGENAVKEKNCKAKTKINKI
jgi:hypothetical protein